MNPKLAWNSLGLAADTERGQYSVREGSYGGFGAFFRPARGRARLPKDQQPLGYFDTIEKAREHCEKHASEGDPNGRS